VVEHLLLGLHGGARCAKGGCEVVQLGVNFGFEPRNFAIKAVVDVFRRAVRHDPVREVARTGVGYRRLQRLHETQDEATVGDGGLPAPYIVMDGVADLLLGDLMNEAVPVIVKRFERFQGRSARDCARHIHIVKDALGIGPDVQGVEQPGKDGQVSGRGRVVTGGGEVLGNTGVGGDELTQNFRARVLREVVVDDAAGRVGEQIGEPRACVPLQAGDKADRVVGHDVQFELAVSVWPFRRRDRVGAGSAPSIINQHFNPDES
jgi:hypothetical protein